MTRSADQMIPVHIYAPAKSVRLDRFGTELARLHRETAPTEYDDGYDITLSVRSDGWILKRARKLGTRGRWIQWQRWKPMSGRQTSTLPQQVRYLIEWCGYTLQAGSIEQVAAGWTALCRQALK